MFGWRSRSAWWSVPHLAGGRLGPKPIERSSPPHYHDGDSGNPTRSPWCHEWTSRIQPEPPRAIHSPRSPRAPPHVDLPASRIRGRRRSRQPGRAHRPGDLRATQAADLDRGPLRIDAAGRRVPLRRRRQARLRLEARGPHPPRDRACGDAHHHLLQLRLRQEREPSGDARVHRELRRPRLPFPHRWAGAAGRDGRGPQRLGRPAGRGAGAGQVRQGAGRGARASDEGRRARADPRRRDPHGLLPLRGADRLPRARAAPRGRVVDPHRDAAGRRPRRGPPRRRLRALRPALLLQELPQGAQADLDAFCEDAEGHRRPAQDLRPLRAPDVLPPLRGRDLRGPEAPPSQEPLPRRHARWTWDRGRLEDPRAARACAPRVGWPRGGGAGRGVVRSRRLPHADGDRRARSLSRSRPGEGPHPRRKRNAAGPPPRAPRAERGAAGCWRVRRTDRAGTGRRQPKAEAQARQGWRCRRGRVASAECDRRAPDRPRVDRAGRGRGPRLGTSCTRSAGKRPQEKAEAPPRWRWR